MTPGLIVIIIIIIIIIIMIVNIIIILFFGVIFLLFEIRFFQNKYSQLHYHSNVINCVKQIVNPNHSGNFRHYTGRKKILSFRFR